MNLEWNVFLEDFNNKCIKEWNIFNHIMVKEDCENLLKEDGVTKESFAKDFKNTLMYCFWCKCEYELILSGWPPIKNFDDKKISIYDQLMLNYDRLIDYIWEKLSDELKGE